MFVVHTLHYAWCKKPLYHSTYMCMCHVQFSYGSKLFVKTFIVCLRLRLFFCPCFMRSLVHDEHFISFLYVRKIETLLSIKLIQFSNRTKDKYDLIVFSSQKEKCRVHCALTVHMKWWSLILNFGIDIPFLSPNYYKVGIHWVWVWVCFCSSEKSLGVKIEK